MPTTGARDIRRFRRFASTAALFCGLTSLALLALLSEPAGATSPKQAPGEVVFSNYGRIVSVKADGTGRKILTRKNLRVGTRDMSEEFFPMGDGHPTVSEDGTRLAFLRTTPTEEDWTVHVMVAGRDGSNPVSIASYETGFINSLDWSGDRLVITRMTFGEDGQGEFEDDEFVSLATDGSGEQVLFKRRYRVKEGDPMAWQSIWLMDVSADGSKLLYLYGDLKGSSLRLRDLGTDTEHEVATAVEDAALSKDGSKVAWVAARCYEKQCDDPDWPQRGLWISGADGSAPTMVLPDEAYISSPDFSPDGERIVFASNRNLPAQGESGNEIYTIAVDGSCLSWLTNGSPASSEPSWVPENLGTAPASCGRNGLGPLVEIKPPKARDYDARPRLWAGPVFAGRLLSSVAYIVPGVRWESYTYSDCGFFDPDRCKVPVAIESGPVCGGMFGPFMRVGPVISASKRRGGLLVTSRTGKGKLMASMFSTGGVTLFVGTSFDYFGRKGLTLREHHRLIDSLRRVGESKPSALPGPRVRKNWVKLTARIKRVMKRTGSVRRTAKELKMTVADVKFGLGLGPVLGRFKPLRIAQCGKQGNSPRSFGVKFP